jgi:hypothetical protein
MLTYKIFVYLFSNIAYACNGRWKYHYCLTYDSFIEEAVVFTWLFLEPLNKVYCDTALHSSRPKCWAQTDAARPRLCGLQIRTAANRSMQYNTTTRDVGGFLPRRRPEFNKRRR